MGFPSFVSFLLIVSPNLIVIIICLVMSEDLDEESSIGSPDAPKVVSRNYFPVGSPVSRDHTIKVYGERAHGKNEDQLALWQKRLEKARKSARSWGTFQITRKMLEEATRLGIRATAVTDLHRMWKDDDSDEFGEKIWNIAYGCFDKHAYWAMDLENDYMSLMNWQYPPRAASASAKSKSCIALLFSHVKNDLVKCLNRAASLSRGGHGRSVRIARTKTDISEDNKNIRRRKGEFLPWMLTGQKKKRKGASPLKGRPPKMVRQDECTPSSVPIRASLPSFHGHDVSPMTLREDHFSLPGISIEDTVLTPKTQKILDLEVGSSCW